MQCKCNLFCIPLHCKSDVCVCNVYGYIKVGFVAVFNEIWRIYLMDVGCTPYCHYYRMHVIEMPCHLIYGSEANKIGQVKQFNLDLQLN